MKDSKLIGLISLIGLIGHLHDAVSEGCSSGLIQSAASLLHQHISTGPQTNITQVLTNQSNNLQDNVNNAMIIL